MVHSLELTMDFFLTMWPTNSTPKHTPKKSLETDVQIKPGVQTAIAAAFRVITCRWKLPKRTSTDEWYKNMWPAHTVEYYSTIKRKECIKGVHATT